MSAMTLEEMVGRRLMLGLPGPEIEDADIRLFEDTRAGGLILYRRNFESPEQLRTLLGYTEAVEVPAGTLVLREGDDSQDMFFVLQGEVRLRRQQLALATLGPGGHFGALGLLTGRPRSASVTAATRLLLARLSPASWADLAGREPALATSN